MNNLILFYLISFGIAVILTFFMLKNQKARPAKIKPEPLLNYVNPSHILYGNKPPLLGGTLKSIPLKNFEKKENIIWMNSPVAYRNTLLRLSKDPDTYDENLLCEFNHFAICHIDKSVGKGVFATKPIKKDTLIGAYTGILELSNKGRYVSYYGLFCLSENREEIFYYDSIQYRNVAAYIQHAPTESEFDVATANINSKIVCQRGIPLSLFLTTRDIEPGEQLLFDYGGMYWHEKAYKLFDKSGNIIFSAASNSQS